MSKLYILTEAGLDVLKKHVISNKEFYKKTDSWSREWLKNLANEENESEKKYRRMSNIEIPDDMTLTYNPQLSKSENDFIAAKTLHENLKDIITPSISGDEQFWTTLCHDNFYSFVQNKYIHSNETHLDKDTDAKALITSRFFFKEGVRRGQERNGLAGLFIAARLTYMPYEADPYQLTRVILSNSNYPFSLLGRSFGANRSLVIGSMRAVKKLTDEKVRFSIESFKEWIKGINTGGGARFIESMSEDDFYQDCYDKIILDVESAKAA